MTVLKDDKLYIDKIIHLYENAVFQIQKRERLSVNFVIVAKIHKRAHNVCEAHQLAKVENFYIRLLFILLTFRKT